MDRQADMSVFWVHVGSIVRFYELYCYIGNVTNILWRDNANADLLCLVQRWLCSSHIGSWCLILGNFENASILSSSLMSKALASTKQALEGDRKDYSVHVSRNVCMASYLCRRASILQCTL
jgi:hypothetical protein